MDSEGDKRKLTLIQASENMFHALWEIMSFVRDDIKYEKDKTTIELQKGMYRILENEGVDLDFLNDVQDIEV